MSNSVIATKNVTKKYHRKLAVDQVSIDIKKGDIWINRS